VNVDQVDTRIVNSELLINGVFPGGGVEIASERRASS
jgi:hypothetical protein